MKHRVSGQGDGARAAIGGGIGAVLLALGWIADLTVTGTPWTLSGLWQLHLAHPTVWIWDLLPLAGAVLGWRLGGEPASRPVQEEVDESSALARRAAHATVQLSLDGILLVDGTGEILSANPAVLRIFGYSEAELVGRRVDVLIPDHGEQEGSVSAYRRTGHDDVLGIEWRMEGVHRDGSRFPIELTDTFVGTAEEAIHIYQLRDISERLQAEEKMRKVNEVLSELRDQALTASRAKSAFLANMSHELRTPLNAILGYSEMLKEEMEDIGQAELVGDLEKIHGAGRHLLSLINSILDLSKIEAGRMELYMETTEVRRTVAEVEELTRPLALRNGNALRVECQDEIGTMVTDQTKLRQILLNLMSNACKFTEEGRVSMVVKRVPHASNDWIHFTIADTGIGMSDEEIGRLFQEFIQADATTTRKFGGTGLGLAISRRFVHMMGGEIKVTSEVSRGSTFTVKLPANTVAPAPQDDQGLVIESDVGDEAARVLVIDDDPGVRDLLARMLAKEGFNVATAASGEQGIRRAESFAPAVITLDVMMPGMDGWSVLAALKQDPVTADIPVVMVSLLDHRRVGYALGAAAYMTKPIDRKRLVETLTGLQVRAPFHVLLVEDEPTVRDVVRRTLVSDGWSVTEAQNGREALKALEGPHKPAAILLDLMMPEMDGFQFLAEVDEHEAWRDIPVVVITAMDLTPEQRARLGDRVERILQKGSYSREELIEVVRAKVHQHVLRNAQDGIETTESTGAEA